MKRRRKDRLHQGALRHCFDPARASSEPHSRLASQQKRSGNDARAPSNGVSRQIAVSRANNPSRWLHDHGSMGPNQTASWHASSSRRRQSIAREFENAQLGFGSAGPPERELMRGKAKLRIPPRPAKDWAEI